MFVLTEKSIAKIVAELDDSEKVLEHVPLIHASYKIGEQGGWSMDELGLIGLTTHVLALIDRLERRSPIDQSIGAESAVEVEKGAMELAERMLAPIFRQHATSVDTSEVVLVALHLAAAKERLGGSLESAGNTGKEMQTVETRKIKVVIGHRLGKGQRIAKGVEEAGGVAIVIPGMAADMKLGDVMNQEKADLGLSFCGSGGAGAITAATKYGYKQKSHLRSIDAGITALRNGAQVLGFGFLDTEELGFRLVNEIRKMRKEE